MPSPTIFRWDPQTPPGNTEYSLAPDVAVIRMADGSARLLDMGDRFYSLPPVAAQMLCETLVGGPAAAAERVAADYGIELTRAQADLKTFLKTLQERGILQRRDGRPQPRTSRAACLSAWLLKGALALFPWQPARAALLLTAAKLSFRLFGWTRTVAAWQRQFPPAAGPVDASGAEAAARAIDEAVCGAASMNPLGVACKERAVTCWALARAAGLPADLVIGVDLFPLTGHCWCEIGSRVVSDHPDNVTPYFPALRY
jgi:hypothetical protein